MLDVATEHWGIMVERVEMWVGKQPDNIKLLCWLVIVPQYVFCLSVRLSVRDVQVPWSHRLKYFENNFTAE